MKTIQFCTMVRRNVENALGDGYTVTYKKVTKNNGEIRTGISIATTESNMAPMIYIDDMDGDTKQVTAKVLEVYKNSKRDSIDTDVILSWDKARDKVFPKLINTERNTKLLEDLVSIPLCDLSVVCYVRLKDGSDGMASTNVTKQLLDTWGITDIDLMQVALSNLSKEIYFTDMESMLVGGSNINLDDFCLEPGLYVLSNKNKRHGAASILDIRTLEKIGDNFYIIPSSVHEVIIVPMEIGDPESLTEMIRSVNASSVDAEEILSDHPYVFHKGIGVTCC